MQHTVSIRYGAYKRRKYIQLAPKILHGSFFMMWYVAEDHKPAEVCMEHMERVRQSQCRLNVG